MSERPDMERLREDLGFPPKLIARTISGYWRQKLLDTIDYAASLERELGAARERDRDFCTVVRRWLTAWDAVMKPPPACTTAEFDGYVRDADSAFQDLVALGRAALARREAKGG